MSSKPDYLLPFTKLHYRCQPSRPVYDGTQDDRSMEEKKGGEEEGERRKVGRREERGRGKGEERMTAYDFPQLTLAASTLAACQQPGPLQVSQTAVCLRL